MSDPLTDQLEQWGRSRAEDLSLEANDVPDEFVRGVRRVRRVRRVQYGAVGALSLILLGVGVALLLPPAPSTSGGGNSIAIASPQSVSGGFTVAQILRANRHFESEDLRLPEVSLAWTREQPQLW